MKTPSLKVLVVSWLSFLFELQAGFLITNAVRFIFKAPGIASWQYTLLQLQVKDSFELHCSSSPEHHWDWFPPSATCFILRQHPVHTLVCPASRSSQWSRTAALPWPFLLDCPLRCLLSLSPCMYIYVCVYVSIYVVSFAFKLVRVYAKFSRKTSCNLVWFIHGLLHYKPLRVRVSPPVLLPALHCSQCKQSPSFPPLSFTHPLTGVEKMSCKRSDFFLSLCLLVITIFFSGEWCPTHPSVALSCPVDPCYSLWRSQSLGPDEQGLIHLTGRYLSMLNHCREKGRRWEWLCEVSTMNSADVSM